MGEIKIRNIGDVVYVKCKIEDILDVPINGITTRAYLLSRDEIYNQASPWIIAYPEDIGLKKELES